MSSHESAIDRVVAANSGPNYEFPPPQPALGLLILTCMDARLDPHAMLGIGLGDAHILRNAGGMVTDDVVESIAISQKMQLTREIMVIHHTNCLTHGDRAPTFTPFQTAKWVADTLRADPRLPFREQVRGFVFSVEDGSLTEV